MSVVSDEIAELPAGSAQEGSEAGFTFNAQEIVDATGMVPAVCDFIGGFLTCEDQGFSPFVHRSINTFLWIGIGITSRFTQVALEGIFL